MKAAVGHRVVVAIGQHGPLPTLIGSGEDRDVLVLALGPRMTLEQQRAVERAIASAFELRVQFEARIATADEIAALVAGLPSDVTLRLYALSRRDLRALGIRRG